MNSSRNRWIVAVGVTLAVALLIQPLADAQQRTGQQRGRGMMAGRTGQAVCDVEGLWTYAAFDARLTARQLNKLRPVCQTAYTGRAKVRGEMRELFRDRLDSEEAQRDRRAAAEKLRTELKELGETMVTDAKKVLGDAAEKLEPWFAQRKERLENMQNARGQRGPGQRMGMRRGGQRRPIDSDPDA